MYRYPVDRETSRASMMSDVDQTGCASLNRSRIWNVLARLPPPLSAISSVVTRMIVSHYVGSVNTREMSEPRQRHDGPLHGRAPESPAAWRLRSGTRALRPARRS